MMNALVLLINSTHERRRWRKHLFDEDENGLLRRQLDPFANHVDELAYGQIL